MQRTLAALVGIVVLAVAYYLVSPLWRTNELDEDSPVDAQVETTASAGMNESMEVAMERMKDEKKEMTESMPSQTAIVAQAPFIPGDHDVEGRALLIRQADGNHIVRFEDFSTINGPNLHIYLASDLDGDDHVDLGPIRATHGNVNYEVPAGTDTSKYRHVLVWCVPFGVLFSSASL
jgi:hypothetical protein